MRVLLVGNQNGGKSTVYGALTGVHRRVGNYPGVTVDVGEGKLRAGDRVDMGGTDIDIVDLPGVYSLCPYTAEERVTREVIEGGDYDAIVNVVDATTMRRGLYLTLRLLRTLSPKVPVIIALNMMDEVRARGGRIKIGALRTVLGVHDVIAMSAARGEGTGELAAAILSLTCREHTKVKIDDEVSAESVYREVDSVCGRCVYVPESPMPRADSIILGKCAWPIFAAVMGAAFFVTFRVGGAMSNALGELISYAASGAGRFLLDHGVSAWAAGLVCDGIISGVGGVLGFFPSLILLWTFMAVLEDSGYLSRVSFFTDGVMHHFGLSGRSIAPLIFGFGCTVPAVMAARSVGTSDRVRLRTIFAAPFMSCGAKLPVFAMMAGAFFPGYEHIYVFFMYATGIAVAVIGCAVTSRGVDGGDNVVELPPYRMPRLRVTSSRVLSRAREFAVRACTVILLASVAVWVLSSVDASLHPTASACDSLLAGVGRVLSPIFSPLGFGDWRASSALAAGIGAKEAIVGTLTVLTNGDISAVFTPASAVSFGVFILLYTPCASALSAIASEAGIRRAALCAVGQTLLAWCAAAIVWALI